MDYDLIKACSGCPFLKDEEGNEKAVRLRLGRVVEIHNAVTRWNGGQFPCHKTTTLGDYDDDGDEVTRLNQHKEKHCAGALAYAGKIGAGDGTQISKYAVYAIMKKSFADYGPPEAVFDSLEEFKASSWEAREARRNATGEVENYEGEPCSSVGPGCIAPAGWLDGGDVVEGTDYADTECSECGDPLCSECADDDGRCIFCAEMDES